METPREIIDRIRRKEFLIGVKLTSEVEEGANNLRLNLNNALKRLSEDLYSKDTHFVLELIQNADDNGYRDGIEPQITFTLSAQRLQIQNNETGFLEPNVVALCRVGRSTKEKRVGFIGEKGIGFKSVFTATDRPQIHSNGFHFGFDRSDPGQVLGYVVPQWIDGASFRNDLTTIILPAKTGAAFSNETLEELSDDLLLFLRKLRRMAVVNEIDRTRKDYRRSDKDGVVTLDADTIVLNTGQKKESIRRQFKYIQHTYSTADLKEEKREGIQEASIVLAFPISEDGKASAERSCKLFAFLPVRDIGFRFLVQADFLLSANREDIHKNPVWNKRAKEEISRAFISALGEFRKDVVLSKTYLQYVPRKGDIGDVFFAEAADKIVAELKESECILAASGSWRKPKEVLVADDDIRALYPNEELKRILGLEYISKDIDAPQATLERLGVGSFGLHRHLFALLEKDDQLGKRGIDWLQRLYRYCSKKVSGEVAVTGFRNLKAIMLDGGELVSLKDGTIYFPLQRKGRRYGFEDELPLLHPELIGGDGSQEVAEFLTRIGLATSQPYSLVINHILPKHADTEWTKSKLSALVGHVRYIKDFLPQFLKAAGEAGESEAGALEKLGKGLFVQSKKMKDGVTYFARPASMYLGTEYGPPIALEQWLGQVADPAKFVADAYINRGKRYENDEDADRRAWREFFYQIGVNQIPAVEYGANPAPSAELAALLSAPESKMRRLAIQILDRHWAYYSQYLVAKTQRRGYSSTSPSTLQQFLQNVVAPSKKRGELKLGETFLDAPHVRAVFGPSAAYLEAEVENSEFLDAVGVTHRIDVVACFKRLDQLRATEKGGGKDVKLIYRELEKLISQEAKLISTGFADVPRVLVPGADKWCTTSEVVWESSGAFVDGQFPPLSGMYRDYYTFFCQHLRISRRAREAALVQALTHLDEYGDSYVERRSEAVQIYVRLARALSSERENDPTASPDWLSELQIESAFLDHRDQLVGASDGIHINDDVRLADAFKSYEGISLLDVEAWRLPQLVDLFEHCGIPRLSQAATYTLAGVKGAVPDEEVTQRIRRRVPELMRLLYFRAHPAFTIATRNELWGHLRRFELKTVDVLDVRAEVNGQQSPVPTDTHREGLTIYVKAGARGKPDKIAQEVCAYLGSPSLSEGVFRILTSMSQADLEDFFDVKSIPAIPTEHLAQILREAALPPKVEEPETQYESEETVENALSEPADQPQIEPPVPAPTPLPPTPSNPSATTSSPPAQTPTPADTSSTASTATHPQSPPQSPPVSNPTQSPTRRRQTERRPSGRLLSYAEPSQSPDRERLNEATENDRLKIAQAAVDHVLEQERKIGHAVVPMPHNNEGFDIRRGPDGDEEFIEVKGLSGAWGAEGIILTPAELRMAERHRTRYWLYVVEYAMDASQRQLHIIQDPFGKTNQFRFDGGWKGATIGAIQRTEPTQGLRIIVDDLGEGTILSVTGGGVLRRLEIQLDSGVEVITRTYDPSKMTIVELA